MTLIGTASVRFAILAALTLLVAGEGTTASQAAKPSYSDAMAACRARYGKKVVNVIIHKDGKLACQWRVMRPARPMTHAEAYEACRKKFGATTVFLRKRKTGWRCYYRPRY